MDGSNPLAEMRLKLLQMNSSDVGLSPTAELPNVWGVVMDMGYPDTLVTVLTIADGTSSVYIGQSGVIGAGEHPPVRAAGEALLKTAEACLEIFKPEPDVEAPGVGEVRFHVLTHAGRVGGSWPMQVAGEGVGLESAMFHAGQALLSQVRMASERARDRA